MIPNNKKKIFFCVEGKEFQETSLNIASQAVQGFCVASFTFLWHGINIFFCAEKCSRAFLFSFLPRSFREKEF